MTSSCCCGMRSCRRASAATPSLLPSHTQCLRSPPQRCVWFTAGEIKRKTELLSGLHVACLRSDFFSKLLAFLVQIRVTESELDTQAVVKCYLCRQFVQPQVRQAWIYTIISACLLKKMQKIRLKTHLSSGGLRKSVSTPNCWWNTVVALSSGSHITLSKDDYVFLPPYHSLPHPSIHQPQIPTRGN